MVYAYGSPPPYTAPRGEYANYYRRSQLGGSAQPAFGGVRRQRGHGLFGSIIRTAMPFLQNIGKSAFKAVAPTLLSTGKGILSDVLGGQNLKASVKQRSTAAAKDFVGRAAKRYLSSGGEEPTTKRRRTTDGGRRGGKGKSKKKKKSLLV